MILSISEMLSEVNSKKTKQERIDTLRYYGGFPMRHILRGAFDPAITWIVDKNPQYRPNIYHPAQDVLLRECKTLYRFVSGDQGNPNIPQKRREELWIQFLESIDPNDAKLMLDVVQKKISFKNITSELVLEAMPGLY